MNLRKVDLNLLVIFDALMQEKNVTKAANRVALSQPAFSNALSRLRHYLKDDLFVRSPDGMLPTPRARELAPHISGVISILQSALEPGEFDPACDSKVFRISANDYLVATTITELMVRLNEEGPNLDVRVIDRGINPKKVYRALDTGEIDLAIGAYGDVPERYGVFYIADTDFVCMMRSSHPLAEGYLTLKRFAKAKHLLVTPGGDALGFVDEALARAGLSRRISLTVNHFSVVPALIARTDMITTIPRRIARTYEPLYDIKLRPSPVETPGKYATVALIWHKEFGQNRAQSWFRDQLLKVTEEQPDFRGKKQKPL